MIVDSFGSPTIQHDLDVFDAQWGLPDTVVRVIHVGAVPPFDPADPTMVGWAQETTLDVEYAHAIAPGAKIVLAETPVAETEGVTGFPEMMDAEKRLIDQGIGDVITQSFGATENTFPGFDDGDFSSLRDLRYAFKDAARHGVTVLASSGDDGATDFTASGEHLYPYAVNSWPSSDPLVTSVGGSQLNLDDTGNRLSPRRRVERRVRGRRRRALAGVRPAGLPDRRHQGGRQPARHPGHLDERGGRRRRWVYYSFVNPASPWHMFGGTSEASPDLLRHRRAGRPAGRPSARPDSTPRSTHWARSAARPGPRRPESSTSPPATTASPASPAPAGPGYDLASGWGTIDAAKFVPALARFG